MKLPPRDLFLRSVDKLVLKQTKKINKKLFEAQLFVSWITLQLSKPLAKLAIYEPPTFSVMGSLKVTGILLASKNFLLAQK